MPQDRQATRAKAELLFAQYGEMGPRRSLRALAAQLQILGASTSLGTLKRYSGRFAWQERAREYDARLLHERREGARREGLAMHERHARLSRAVLGAGGTALQQLLDSRGRLAEMTPPEIARLIELGMKAESRATGATVDRRDIGLSVWNEVTVALVGIFMDVNEEPDVDTRARMFGRRLDALVDSRLKEFNEGGAA